MGALSNELVRLVKETHDAFRILAGVVPDSGYCNYLYVLLSNWRFLPDLPLEESQWLQDQLWELQTSGNY